MHVLTSTGAIRAWASIVLLIVGFGLALGLTIAYVNRVDQRAEQRNIERTREICGLLRVMDDAYTDTPPTTDTGRNIATELHAYRLRIGC